MKEQPKVKMSVDMGRSFMLAQYSWFDTDMCQSSVGLKIPPNDSPSTEKIKYTLCRHALNAYEVRRKVESADTVLEVLWFTYGFAPCGIEIAGRPYVALVSLRGVCWVDQPLAEAVNPDGRHYAHVYEQVMRIRGNLLEALRAERHTR